MNNIRQHRVSIEQLAVLAYTTGSSAPLGVPVFMHHLHKTPGTHEAELLSIEQQPSDRAGYPTFPGLFV